MHFRPASMVLLPFLLVTACATPSPHLIGADKSDLTIDGYGITVFHKGNQVQAVRTTFARPSDRGKVLKALESAVVTATGCAKIGSKEFEAWTILNATIDC